VSPQSTSTWFTFAERVNGVEFDERSIGSCGGHPTNFDVVIRDRQLRCFALREEFVLEIRGGEHARAICQRISLAELKVLSSRRRRKPLAIRALAIRIKDPARPRAGRLGNAWCEESS
jgi:hypothetical protein